GEREATLIKAVAQDELDEQAVGLGGEAEAYPKVAPPARAKVGIEDRKQQMLLLTERIKRRHRAAAAVGLQTRIDLGGDGVARFCIGGKLKAPFAPFPLQTALKHRVERDVPGTPLFIDNGPDLQCPGIR